MNSVHINTARQVPSPLVWSSNLVGDVKNNQTRFYSSSPRPPRCCEGPRSRTLRPRIHHLIAFYWSCPIRCLMFILFPALSPESFCQSQSGTCTSFFLCLNYTQTRKKTQRGLFSSCVKRFCQKPPFACVFLWTRLKQDISWPVVTSHADHMWTLVFMLRL